MLLVLIQTSFLNVFFGPVLNPNLIIALPFALMLAGKSDYSLFSALIGGLLFDLQGHGLLGLSPLLMVTLLYAISYSRKYVFKGRLVQIILIFAAFVIYTVVLSSYSPVVFLNALSTLIACLLLHLYISRVVDKSIEIKI